MGAMGWYLIMKGMECLRARSLGEVGGARPRRPPIGGSIYMKFQKRQLCRDRKQISDGLGLGVTANGHVAALRTRKVF